MKSTYNNQELAHVWAHQLQSSASNQSGTMFFRNGTIYSYGYHFPIARHIVNENGENAVLFTTRGYSNTTAKHIGHVWRACSHMNVIYCNNPEDTHKANFEHFQSLIKIETDKLLRARKPEKYMLEIERIVAMARTYAAFFGLALPDEFNHTFDAKEIEMLKAQAQAKAKAKAKARAEEDAARRAKWLSFESREYHPMNGKELLRMRNGTIETTKGIRFSVDVAKHFFNALKAHKVQTGAKFERYTVLKVSDTLLRIGCHDFDMQYLLNFGAENL